MKLYLVRNHSGEFLFLRHNHMVEWGKEEAAEIYHTRELANEAGCFAFHYDDDCEAQFEIVEIDTVAPIQILRELCEAGDLDDHGFTIREYEGKGFGGPRNLRWSAAYDQAKRLLEVR